MARIIQDSLHESSFLTARKFQYFFALHSWFLTSCLRLADGTTRFEFVTSGGCSVGKWNDRNRAELEGTRTGEFYVLMTFCGSAASYIFDSWLIIIVDHFHETEKQYPVLYLSGNSDVEFLNALKVLNLS